MNNTYILSRCAVHPEHFFIRAAEPGEIDNTVKITGASVQIFSKDLRRKVDDLEQLNFQRTIPLPIEDAPVSTGGMRDAHTLSLSAAPTTASERER